MALAGFLGSGKTTLLLAVARTLTAAGRKVAIIIKALAEVPVAGHIAYSLTGAEPQPRARGGFTWAAARRVSVRVNAILCGADRQTLQDIVASALEQARPRR